MDKIYELNRLSSLYNKVAMAEIHNEVKEYYGKTLQTTDDLQTNACCTMDAPPKNIQKIISEIHDEVNSKYYGCGICIPHELDGLNVLDLGSGSGRDCYILSKLVGQKGSVIGVDMTDEQLNVANKYIDYHTQKFGYTYSNVKFVKANIEALEELDIEPGSLDLIISNCVINLAEDKRKVFEQAYRLLKPGGEIYFSDIYANRRVPEDLRKDPVLWGECLSGSLYWNDFIQLAKSSGFTDPRMMESSEVTVNNEEAIEKLGNIRFYSATYRLFKIDNLESDCEDYGQAVRYKGTIENNEAGFNLDNHHHFQKGKIEPVCGNTYLMLKETRLAKHFEFMGDFSTHYGIFEGCGVDMPFSETQESSDAACC